MNPLALGLLIVALLLLLFVPRRHVLITFIAAAVYLAQVPALELGVMSLPILRLMILTGFIRVLIRGEFQAVGFTRIDAWIVCWGIWVVFASFFHLKGVAGAGPVYSTGVVFSVVGAYILFRIWVHELRDLKRLIVVLPLILIPAMLGMIVEKAAAKNVFSILGYVEPDVLERNGRFRAQGPFGHAILAGTVAANAVPWMIGIWREHRFAAAMGIFVALVMVFTSTSSGPVLSLMAGVGAVILWRYRQYVPLLLWGAVAVYVAAEIYMERPAYYLLSKVDITGGSTGWHRSRLIEATLEHFDEWWLFGTDITRHWMPHGAPIGDGRHIDITNYYVSFVVIGGLLSLILMIFALRASFRAVRKMIIADEVLFSGDQRFFFWCLGAALFSHVTASISVAYFDQSVLFFWLSIACISSFSSRVSAEVRMEEGKVGQPVISETPVPVGVVDHSAWRAEWRRQLRERDQGY